MERGGPSCGSRAGAEKHSWSCFALNLKVTAVSCKRKDCVCRPSKPKNGTLPLAVLRAPPMPCAELMAAMMAVPWPLSSEYPEECRYSTLLQIRCNLVLCSSGSERA